MEVKWMLSGDGTPLVGLPPESWKMLSDHPNSVGRTLRYFAPKLREPKAQQYKDWLIMERGAFLVLCALCDLNDSISFYIDDLE